MRKYIRKIRSKEEHVRKRILVSLMTVSMLFVGTVWVYSFGDKFNKENAEQVKQDVKPFELFANALSDTYKNVSASVGNISSGKKSKVSDEKVIDLVPVEPKY